jgi:hypothetical protein
MQVQTLLHCSACLAALAVAVPVVAQESGSLPVDLELVLAVDISGSIDDDEAKLQREGYTRALAHPEIIQAIQSGMNGRIAITYVEWASDHHQQTVVEWTLVSDDASAKMLADVLAEAPLSSGQSTSISGTIDYSAKLFADNGFKGIRSVIDISGDGDNNNGRPAEWARDQAVAAGITINGLPILNGRPNRWGGTPSADLDRYFQEYVIGGPGAFIVVAEDFTAFARAIKAVRGALAIKSVMVIVAADYEADALRWHKPTIRQRTALVGAGVARIRWRSALTDPAACARV